MDLSPHDCVCQLISFTDAVPIYPLKNLWNGDQMQTLHCSLRFFYFLLKWIMYFTSEWRVIQEAGDVAGRPYTHRLGFSILDRQPSVLRVTTTCLCHTPKKEKSPQNLGKMAFFSTGSSLMSYATLPAITIVPNNHFK